MNWYVGQATDGTFYARILTADGTNVVTVAGLTRREAVDYPSRWVMEHTRASRELEAAAAVAREVELLKALVEVQPMGQVS